MSEELAPGPGIAVLVIPMPGGMETPTDTVAAMIAWLFRHGGPRTGEVARSMVDQALAATHLDPARLGLSAAMCEIALATGDLTAASEPCPCRGPA